MQSGHDKSLKLIHLCGAAGMLVCVVTFFSLSSANHERRAQEVKALELSLQQDQDHRLALLEARETQATLNAKHATALKDTGAPPPDVSFETYIEMIAKAASRNELQIIRHIPLDSQAYPGLIVRQFTIEVAGTFGDLMEFLRITEAMNCWADISHFKIDKPLGLAGNRSRIQSALLTFALFSSDSERFRGGT